MNFTYIGAPWSINNTFGGNGGLSLRHAPQHIKLLENLEREPESEWEDVWLSEHLAAMEGSNMPSANISRFFSVESVWTERPCGYHLRGNGKLMDGGIWHDESRRREVLEWCPEIKIALDVEMPLPQ